MWVSTDKKLAIWTAGWTGHTTCCLLCLPCYARFKSQGTGGIPNAASQSRNGAAAARNKRNSAPLVSDRRN